MMTMFSGLHGLLNAYKSVLSASGSFEINGASRWLDALVVLNARVIANTAADIFRKFFIVIICCWVMLETVLQRVVVTSPRRLHVREVCFERCVVLHRT